MGGNKALLTALIGFVTAFISVFLLIVIVALVLTMYLSAQNIDYFSIGPKGILNIFTYSNIKGSTDTSFRAGGLLLSLFIGVVNAFLSYFMYSKYNKKMSKIAG